MKTVKRIVSFNIISIIFAIGGIIMAILNSPYWGWLIAVSVLCWEKPKNFNNIDDDEQQ